MKKFRNILNRSLAVICSLFVFTSIGYAEVDGSGSQDNGFQPITVVVVRHAEKAVAPKRNPKLTPEGKARAEDLARIFRASDVDFVYSSQYERTRATVAPLAKRFGISTQIVRSEKIDELVTRVMANRGSFNVVCGHSNTVPQIIEALGGEKIAAIADDEYDNIWIVTVYAPGKASVARIKY